MALITIVVSVLVALTQAPPAPQERPILDLDPAQLMKIKWVEIDGSKDPKAVPEYIMWQHVYRFIGARHSNPDFERALEAEVHLAPNELAIVDAAAAAQAKRAEDCHARAVREQLALKERRTPTVTITRLIAEVSLECRTVDLEAAENVLTQLSGEGRNSLRTFAEKIRRTITISVPAHELAFFRLPR